MGAKVNCHLFKKINGEDFVDVEMAVQFERPCTCYNQQHT